MRYSYVDVQAGPFSFEKQDTLRLYIELEQKPIEFEPVVKTEESIDQQLERIGFYKRKAEGLGFFYDKDDIEKEAIRRVEDIFHRIPGVVVVEHGAGLYLSSIRNLNSSILKDYIPVNVYIDGTKIDMEKDERGYRIGLHFLEPQYIKAIEIYPSSSRAPAEYGGMSEAGGVVLIWTGR